MDQMSDLYGAFDKAKDMEELYSEQVEGEDLSASNMNVYITVDPASLQKLRNLKGKKRTVSNTTLGELFTNCLEELDLEADFRFCGTVRGFLMILEAVLALTLLLICALSYPGNFGWGAQIYFAVANSINLPVCLLHLVYQCLSGNWSSFTALRKALCFVAEFFLLVLQIVSFILVVAVGRESHPEVVIFTIFTLVQCACLIASLILSNQELSGNKVQSVTRSKKERLRRKRLTSKKYKRLHHSGF